MTGVQTCALPISLQAARANLDGRALRPFAELAIGALENIGPRLATVCQALPVGSTRRPPGVLTGQAAGRPCVWLEILRGEIDTNASGNPIHHDVPSIIPIISHDECHRQRR